MKRIWLPVWLLCLSNFITSAQTNEPIKAVETGIHLRDAQFSQALEMYAQIKGRTILQHPLLKSFTFSLDAEMPTAAAAFEDVFRQHGVVTIPDGDKFVMVVPITQTNYATPRSDKIVSTVLGDLSSLTNNEAMPRGTVNFKVGLEQVIPIYGELIQRERAGGLQHQTGVIQLKAASAISKAELIYALETLFAWSGVKMIPVTDKTFKAVSVNE